MMHDARQTRYASHLLFIPRNWTSYDAARIGKTGAACRIHVMRWAIFGGEIGSGSSDNGKREKRGLFEWFLGYFWVVGCEFRRRMGKLVMVTCMGPRARCINPIEGVLRI